MSNYIKDKNMDKAHFREKEEMQERMDEIHKLFDGIKQNIDAIISMIDDTLAQEDEYFGVEG